MQSQNSTKFQISLGNILKNKRHHVKVLAMRFHMNDHNAVFRRQTQTLEPLKSKIIHHCTFFLSQASISQNSLRVFGPRKCFFANDPSV